MVSKSVMVALRLPFITAMYQISAITFNGFLANLILLKLSIYWNDAYIDHNIMKQ